MPRFFCTYCGAEGVPAGARYCSACGRAVSSGPFTIPRIPAPALVFSCVLLVGAAAVVLGRLGERVPPRVPGRSAPGSAELPEGHPPIELPEDVRAMIRGIREEAERDPENVEKWKKAAAVQYRAAQFDRAYLAEAEKAYRRVLELDPADLEALRQLGNLAFEREAADEAIRYYRAYLERKPEDLDVRTDMATMYMARGDLDRAISLYREILRSRPGFFEALFNLGIAYHEKGDLQQAVETFRAAQKAAPDDRFRERVGEVLARLGAASSFEAEAEGFFRNHPMVGPKLESISWSGDEMTVRLRDFPMDAMPEPVRERFLSRIHEAMRSAKRRHGKTEPLVVRLVDAGSGNLMQSLTE
ncbi:MAG: hypothetical protein KatS3mg076_2284 [Candidatus Binatia bacterium]|nr:MAG: hypothetical protein KatS3mg076_2284 [Candidatus Binatia bacterium]